MNRNKAFELAIKALEQARDKYSAKNSACLAHGDDPPESYVKARREYKEFAQAIAIMEQERDHQQIELTL